MTQMQSDECANLKDRIDILTRRLRLRETQIAGYGSLDVPPHIFIDKEEAKRELEQARLAFHRLCDRSTEENSPYIGLQTFQESDAIRFFGRDTLLAEVVAKVEHTSFVAILGPSGSGKSSIVRAGLLPMLKSGALPGSEHWYYPSPFRPGPRPLNILAATLAELRGGKLGDVKAIRDLLLKGDALTLATDILRLGQETRRCVLVVDQFEELWTQAQSGPEMRNVFIAQLLAAADLPDIPILVVVTMRADFLHYAAEHHALARWIAKNLVIVGPMNKEELEHVIVCPAEYASGIFEPGLVDELVEQTVGRPGALPLLEYTLLELWKARQPDGAMTWAVFRAIGEVEGALAARADTILGDRYPNMAQRDELRTILLRLVQPGEGAVDTRRRVPLQSLVAAGGSVEDIQALLKPLADERLITTGRDEDSGEATVELAHEALIRAWPTFERWIKETREDLRIQLQLEAAVKEWTSSNENEDFLWGGLRLARVTAWVSRTQPRLNVYSLRFLATSRALELRRLDAKATMQRENEQARSFKSHLRRISVWLLLIFVLTISMLKTMQDARNAIAQGQASEQAGEALYILDHKPDQADLMVLAAVHSTNEPYPPTVARAMYSNIDRALVHDTEKWYSNGAPTAIAWSPDGQGVLIGDHDGNISIWEIKTNKQVWNKQLGPVTTVAWRGEETGEFNADGQIHTDTLVFAGGEDGIAHIWNASTDLEVDSLAIPSGPITAVAWKPDTNWTIAIGYNDGTIIIWNKSLTPLSLKKHNGAIRALAWSADGNKLLSGADDQTAWIWDMVIERDIFGLSEHTGSISALAWSPNGQQVTTGDHGGTARIWDATTGTIIWTLTAHTSALTTVAYSLNGQHVFTGDDSGTAHLWDVKTGADLKMFSGSSGTSWTTMPNLEGRWVLTNSNEQMMQTWIVDNRLLIAALTERICKRFTDENKLRQAIPAWRGCDTEKAAVSNDFSVYQALGGQP
jgi:WD40 repeat protein